jgi:long-chain acyl-CoA synthetase
MPLISALKDSSARNQAKVAIAFGEKSFTYCEMDRLTDNIASNLRGHGIEPGDRAAIHLLNGPELALTIIGCLKAGAVAVPLNALLRGREIDYILRHSGSIAYIGQPELYSGISETCPALKDLESHFLTGETANPACGSFQELLRRPEHAPVVAATAATGPDEVAAILYTSGTTSHPKGVVHTKTTLTQTAEVMRQMNLDENQVVLVMSSMAHLIGFGMLFLSALLNGATTVITRSFDFESALAAFARWKCTYTVALPIMFKLLLDQQRSENRDVSSGRYYFCGGDSVSPSLQRSFESRFGPVCEAYGTTEMAPISWNRPGNVRVGSIGQPAPGVRVRLTDSRGNDVQPGEIGEVCVQGPHLMTGYWQDADTTNAAFRGSWYRTGDLAREDSDGFYWFAGRTKEVIIRGGSNISPQEVEGVLTEHPAVAEVAVVGHPDAIWGETVAAHVVLKCGHGLDEQQLIEFARKRLADYKVPEIVIFQADLPKGPTGKLRRQDLRQEHGVFAPLANSK